MMVPTAAVIEKAKNQLTDISYIRAHEQVFIDQQMQLDAAIPQVSNDFQSGYDLGLQAARVMVAG